MTDTFTIGALAAEFGVTHRALRFYEDRGLLRPERRGTTRVYSAACRERARRIVKWTGYGFSLIEISRMIEKTDRELRDLLAGRAEDFDREITTQHENLSALHQEIARIDREWAA